MPDKTPNKKLNVVLLSGGPSPEHDISLKTGAVILNALDKTKYNITPIVVPRDGQLDFAAVKNADVVFIAMHGTFGEDGTIQGILEWMRVPYTGSGVLASALAMDKVKSNEIFSFYGLMVPRYASFTRAEWNGGAKICADVAAKLGLPFVVKPSNCGSSVGITIVKNAGEIAAAFECAFKYDSAALAQEFVSGDEVTCAVLDDGSIGGASGAGAMALPPTQIIPKTSAFFDFEAKYTPGATEEITPPRLPQDVIKKIQDVALRAHAALGCSGMSRTDMIVREKIFVLETNTIPGMTETSLLPQAAAAAGIKFPELLNRIIDAAINDAALRK